MVIKKHTWFRYGKNKGEICEIIIRDLTRRKLDFFRVDTSNQNSLDSASRILKSSYGILFRKLNEVEKKEEEKIELQKAMKEDLGF